MDHDCPDEKQTAKYPSPLIGPEQPAVQAGLIVRRAGARLSVINVAVFVVEASETYLQEPERKSAMGSR
jgi:hypothetical protein